MKVHQFACGFWDLDLCSLSHGCKCLRPLAPNLQSNTDTAISTFDLKNYIRPDSGHKLNPSFSFSSDDKRDSPQVSVEAHPGGTRWNPTQEQIGILEMLYRGGMRTPNVQEIEQITKQLCNYGKIEGKNVFYWFQNHKARARQKQKRNSHGVCHSPRTSVADSRVGPVIFFHFYDVEVAEEMDSNRIYVQIEGIDRKREEDSSFKRKCRSWVFECLEEEIINVSNGEDPEDRTLELFPLHPEGR